jgi:hypothetical protein
MEKLCGHVGSKDAKETLLEHSASVCTSEVLQLLDATGYAVGLEGKWLKTRFT